jgi:hypothetical protein
LSSCCAFEPFCNANAAASPSPTSAHHCNGSSAHSGDRYQHQRDHAAVLTSGPVRANPVNVRLGSSKVECSLALHGAGAVKVD